MGEEPATLRPATPADRAFAERLSHDNMAAYRAARNIAWDPARFEASWASFDNRVIESRGVAVGVLRLHGLPDALEIRDLQLLPAHQGRGLGAWAVRQAFRRAAELGKPELRLRVFPENPARRLYERLGFAVVAELDGVLHMACKLPPGGPP
ncbi:MAG: GNAT family N-acetyltransferase [Rhizobium sp.]|nr:GNAT family N-acetyltransferase [Rhizobium sp.]